MPAMKTENCRLGIQEILAAHTVKAQMQGALRNSKPETDICLLWHRWEAGQPML